jgi:hypothetical protein
VWSIGGRSGSTPSRMGRDVMSETNLTPMLLLAFDRGTGEQSFLRTKSDISSGANTDQDPSSSSTTDDATTTAGGGGGPKGAPMVVTKTPGSKVLEDLLLARVLGGV